MEEQHRQRPSTGGVGGRFRPQRFSTPPIGPALAVRLPRERRPMGVRRTLYHPFQATEVLEEHPAGLDPGTETNLVDL